MKIVITNMIQRIFCKHESLTFVRNIYGDEINRVCLKHTYRSIWRCDKCGKIFYKHSLFYKDKNNIYLK